MPGLDPRALRRMNTSVTLRTLAVADGAISMSLLAEQAGLSRRTTELILSTLVEAGWVRELDRVPTSGIAGRPARRFELRADYALLAAARITTLEASAIVADVRGHILGRATCSLREYLSPAAALDDVARLVHLALADAGASVTRLRAGAIASGGAIDGDGVVRRLVHADSWVGTDLPRELSRRIDVPWFADNDANLGALAEHWRGAARDNDDVVWALLGNRSGLGILIRGTVHRGFAGAAGEIIEAVTMPAANFDERPIAWLTSPVAEERAAAQVQYQKARAGDAEVLAEVQEFVEHIASILTTLSWTVAPSLIVLGGGLEDAADVLLPRVREAMRRARTPDIELRATTLGADGPLVGALKFVLDRMDTELFGPLVPE
ncbi:ROK family transcriptional regulator [Subtercola lobariae]|uniref:Transcriptional regulator n=1 Tax=Subtercola lobariae TaxID=1588641 RepID=A0A917B8N3_9MICO|nr:ROK family transcriptional regulator [Subtercola lobariae]GGF29025.1 transcriptional regulator [Subtercola lobariae]